MLGSGADAEDATQDTLERAWRRLATYDGSGPFGAWLQRIATNVCLDGLRAKRRRIGPADYGPPAAPGAMPAPPDPELAWVEPVSDSDLHGTADPQDEVVRREDISLAFVAALQRLAPRQRAALLLHDVLAFSHAEVGEVLGAAPPPSTACCRGPARRPRHRRRAAARHHRPQGPAAAGALCPGLAARRHRRLRAAGRRRRPFSMPPLTTWFDGREAAAAFIEDAIFAPGPPARGHLRAGSCNGQPAFATYEPDGQGAPRRQRPAGPAAGRRGRAAPRHGAGVLPRPGPCGPLRTAVLIAAGGAVIARQKAAACGRVSTSSEFFRGGVEWPRARS